MNITDKVVLLTGASSGIGLALTKKLAARGATVLGLARQDQDWKSFYNLATNQYPGKVFPFQVDLAEQTEIERIMQKVKEKWGRIDILVNCAGYGLYGPIGSFDFEQLEHQFRVNFFAPVMLSQAVLELNQDINRRMMIVNVSSVVGFRPLLFSSPYSSNKAALSIFTRTLRLETPEHVHVMLILPGLVRSNFKRNLVGIPNPINANDRTEISSARAAEKITEAIEKEKKEVYFTIFDRLVVWVNFYFWRGIDRWVRLIGKKLRQKNFV